MALIFIKLYYVCLYKFMYVPLLSCAICSLFQLSHVGCSIWQQGLNKCLTLKLTSVIISSGEAIVCQQQQRNLHRNHYHQFLSPSWTSLSVLHSSIEENIPQEDADCSVIQPPCRGQRLREKTTEAEHGIERDKGGKLKTTIEKCKKN